jgi:hypothetical protein
MEKRIGWFAKLVSLLLYLCSQTAEFRPAGEKAFIAPRPPSAKKTKDGWRLFPPDQPKVWYVGERLGSAIREVREVIAAEPERDPAERARPRPHVRRAHWHSYWLGPRNEPAKRHVELQWLPPMAVAMADDSPAVPLLPPKLGKA